MFLELPYLYDLHLFGSGSPASPATPVFGSVPGCPEVWVGTGALLRLQGVGSASRLGMLAGFRS